MVARVVVSEPHRPTFNQLIASLRRAQVSPSQARPFQEGDETGLQPLFDHCFGRFETRMANRLARALAQPFLDWYMVQDGGGPGVHASGR